MGTLLPTTLNRLKLPSALTLKISVAACDTQEVTDINPQEWGVSVDSTTSVLARYGPLTAQTRVGSLHTQLIRSAQLAVRTQYKVAE